MGYFSKSSRSARKSKRISKRKSKRVAKKSTPSKSTPTKQYSKPIGPKKPSSSSSSSSSGGSYSGPVPRGASSEIYRSSGLTQGQTTKDNSTPSAIVNQKVALKTGGGGIVSRSRTQYKTPAEPTRKSFKKNEQFKKIKEVVKQENRNLQIDTFKNFNQESPIDKLDKIRQQKILDEKRRLEKIRLENVRDAEIDRGMSIAKQYVPQVDINKEKKILQEKVDAHSKIRIKQLQALVDSGKINVDKANEMYQKDIETYSGILIRDAEKKLGEKVVTQKVPFDFDYKFSKDEFKQLFNDEAATKQTDIPGKTYIDKKTGQDYIIDPKTRKKVFLYSGSVTPITAQDLTMVIGGGGLIKSAGKGAFKLAARQSSVLFSKPIVETTEKFRPKSRAGSFGFDVATFAVAPASMGLAYGTEISKSLVRDPTGTVKEIGKTIWERPEILLVPRIAKKISTYIPDITAGKFVKPKEITLKSGEKVRVLDVPMKNGRITRILLQEGTYAASEKINIVNQLKIAAESKGDRFFTHVSTKAIPTSKITIDGIKKYGIEFNVERGAYFSPESAITSRGTAQALTTYAEVSSKTRSIGTSRYLYDKFILGKDLKIAEAGGRKAIQILERKYPNVPSWIKESLIKKGKILSQKSRKIVNKWASEFDALYKDKEFSFVSNSGVKKILTADQFIESILKKKKLTELERKIAKAIYMYNIKTKQGIIGGPEMLTQPHGPEWQLIEPSGKFVEKVITPREKFLRKFKVERGFAHSIIGGEKVDISLFRELKKVKKVKPIESKDFLMDSIRRENLKGRKITESKDFLSDSLEPSRRKKINGRKITEPGDILSDSLKPSKTRKITRRVEVVRVRKPSFVFDLAGRDLNRTDKRKRTTISRGEVRGFEVPRLFEPRINPSRLTRPRSNRQRTNPRRTNLLFDLGRPRPIKRRPREKPKQPKPSRFLTEKKKKKKKGKRKAPKKQKGFVLYETAFQKALGEKGPRRTKKLKDLTGFEVFR